MAILHNNSMTSERRYHRIISFFSVLSFPAIFSQLVAQPVFTKITTGPIVDEVSGGASCSWVDYNNDGYLDLFRVNSFDGHVLYENNGAGSFTRLSLFEGTSTPGGAENTSWGDYDNDGYIDLFVTVRFVDHFLYRNNGEGSFTLISNASVNDLIEPVECSWADYDNDGYLDLFIVNYSNENNLLYKNGGQGFFTRIRGVPVVSDGALSRNHSWADYDNDGDLDLFVANDFGENNLLYENFGRGFFKQVTTGSIVTDGGTSRGSSWGDYDNDGDLDLFVANGTSEGNEVNFLYENLGGSTFKRVTNGPIAEDILSEPVGSAWGDYDNDGDLDLVVSSQASGNVLYENNGNGTFTRITSGVIVSERQGSFSAIWGDYDDDGDLDLFIPTAGSASFYRNDGNGNNWLNIKCIGSISNRAAIGAKVRIQATIGVDHVKQMREISSHTGHSAQSSLRAHFGLGDANIVDTVRVEWPSGQVQLRTNVKPNQFLTITEVLPPTVEHTPLSFTEVGNQITIEATGDPDIASVDLLFRRGGDSTFTRVAMLSQGNGSFSGTIPATVVTSRGLEYRFVPGDISGNTGSVPREGTFSIQVTVPNGIARDQEERFGSDQTAYHLFSVPLDLQDKTPAAILEDDMGEYDESRWRFLEYGTEEQSYREFPEIEQLQPGKGYWFLVTEPARVIDTPAGTSFSTAEPRSVLVRSGWNLIGNPFNFNIPASNVRRGLSPVELRSYNGSWNNPISDPVTEIRPFEGYAVMIDEFVAELFVDPNVTVVGLSKASPNSSPKASPPRARQVAPESARRDAVALERGIVWSINVQAQCQQARDVDNVLGVAAQASESWDSLDYPEPPPMGEYVSVYFARPEWGKRSQRFCTDFRPDFSQGGEWTIEVRTNIRDRVELTFAGIESVPDEFDIWLVDETLGLPQNLRRNPHFSVAGVGEHHPKRLKLLVGRSAFVDGLLPEQEIPTDFELSQNFPNPFNPVTSIRYGLPRDERVTLKIFNILGEEVATLLNDEPESPGFHVAIWDGRDRQGRQVASGVYVYELLLGDSRITRKMALVR